MERSGIEIICQASSFFREGFNFGIFEIIDRKRQVIKQGLLFEEQRGNEMLPDTSIIKLTDENAQSLFNSMWLAGLRPSKNLYIQPDLEHISKHLADMRKIAFNKLEIPLKEEK